MDPVARMSGPRWRIENRQLLFDGQPVLLLGGQLHNSTASSSPAAERAFAHAAALGANTVIAPVTWDLFEPEEGSFDFSVADALLSHAHTADLHLVVLWFGAFKNAASTYAPRWVRADAERFPRAEVGAHDRPPFTYEGATPKPVLSVFSPALRDADGAAFEQFVRFLAEHPFRDRVALLQVENEVGLLADSRDRSAIAEAAWGSPVPDDFLAFLRGSAPGSIARSLWEARGGAASGTWSEVLGEGWEADEVFMAWGFSTYVESLARRAAGIWPIPLYANAWLGPQPGQDRAGQYPSGGPGSRVLDVWRAGAPSLSMLCPDIYVEEAGPVVRTYASADRALFVPECRVRVADIAMSLAQGAVGWSAFGLEDVRVGSQVSQLLGQLTQIEPVLAAAQREGRVTAIVLGSGSEERVVVGDVELVARGTRALFERMLLDAGVGHPVAAPPPPEETQPGAAVASPHDTRPFGLIVDEGDDTFLVFGQGLTLDFFPAGSGGAAGSAGSAGVPAGPVIEYDSVVEGRFVDGAWAPGRSLNGDERLRILPLDEIGAVRIRLVRVSGGMTP